MLNTNKSYKLMIVSKSSRMLQMLPQVTMTGTTRHVNLVLHRYYECCNYNKLLLTKYVTIKLMYFESISHLITGVLFFN